jgi:co-chaperonin GroES (HSP10)
MSLPVEVSNEALLPVPAGYKILIAIPHKEEKFKDTSIIMPEALRKAEETASIVGCVIALGDSAYADPSKFPDGPWCKQGDWVIFRSYSGTRFKIEGDEFRLINDDTVEATVDDPRAVQRAY